MKKSTTIKNMWTNIAIYSGIQILMSIVTIVAQYIFVTYTYYENFTRMHATTLWGTMVLRIVFGSTFFFSGIFGFYACCKKSTMSVLLSLVFAGISSCFCLIYLGESAVCTMYVVSKMEEKPEITQYISNGENVINFDIEIGEDSLEVILPEQDAKFLLALFSTQLIVCLIQGVISIIFCSALHKSFKETATVKSYRGLKYESYNKEIYTTAI